MIELPIKMQAVVYTMSDDLPRYLLLRRTMRDGGFWQTLTGTLHKDEAHMACLRREIEEETGITELEDISACLHHFYWRRPTGERIEEFVHAVRVNDDAVIRLSADEHDEYRWCRYDDARSTLGKENNKTALDIINGYLTGA